MHFLDGSSHWQELCKTSHGNTLSIEFEYPEQNHPEYVQDITKTLQYAGVFHGISTKDANLE